MIIKTRLFALALMSLLLACNQNPGPQKKESLPVTKKVEEPKREVISADSLKETVVVPTLENKIPEGKNVIYSAAFMYAWYEVEKLVGGNITIEDAVNSDFWYLTHSKSYRKTLLSDEYKTNVYVDSLTGAFTALAEFYKPLPFTTRLHQYTGPVKFNGQGKLEFFGITNYHDEYAIKQLKILHYKNDYDFIISLQPEDQNHEIILVMNDKYETNLKGVFNSATNKITAAKMQLKSKKLEPWKTTFNQFDQLAIPSIDLFVSAVYHNIEGRPFKSGSKPHVIIKAMQTINFKFNRHGAELEDIAMIQGDSAVIIQEPPRPKAMFFNKPFAIFLKRKDAEYPYFGMMINNSELLVPFKK